MTESEWNACTEPQKMLAFLRDSRASERRLRLFAVGCCRRVWHLLGEERLRRAVEVAERDADGLAGRDDVVQAVRTARQVYQDWGEAGRAAYYAAWHSRGTVAERLGRVVWYATWAVAHQGTGAGYGDARGKESAAVSVLARCIFGPLSFRPVPIDAAWLTWNGGTVRRLAEVAYKERELPAGTLDAGRLGVVADALEEAGCTNAEILSHLRGPGPHVRGCWALDLLLDRE
jgi:hypothetical protein